jgi:hypothetical protein
MSVFVHGNITYGHPSHAGEYVGYNFNDSLTAVPSKKDSTTATSLSNRPQITPKVTVTKLSFSVA